MSTLRSEPKINQTRDGGVLGYEPGQVATLMVAGAEAGDFTPSQSIWVQLLLSLVALGSRGTRRSRGEDEDHDEPPPPCPAAAVPSAVALPPAAAFPAAAASSRRGPDTAVRSRRSATAARSRRALAAARA